MKINWNMIDADMLNDYRLPKAPSMFRSVAENLIGVVSRTEFNDYNKISQFDKELMVAYWRQVDGLDSIFSKDYNLPPVNAFEEWFMFTATQPELIRRARQWLVEHNYLIPKASVDKHAQEAGKSWARGF